MKSYSIGVKIRYNYTDCHPKKGDKNWWEFMSYSGSNTATRMRIKREIRKLV